MAAKAEATPEQLPPEWRGRYLDVLMLNARRARLSMYVSCWHLSDHESEAMWRLYARSGYAVALQTTYERLVRALPAKIHNGCFLGLVRYADHHSEVLPEGNVFHPIMHKRTAFAHESEVRAVIWMGDPGEQVRPRLDDNPPGLLVPISIGGLLERIVVSPEALHWFVDAVKGVVGAYLPGTEVVRSGLLDPPYI